jgi:HSP20 family protein
MASTLFPITRGFADVDRAFNRVVRDAFAPMRSTWAQTPMVQQPIPVDIYANDDQAVITAALPGVQPADLDLKVHQNQVTISGKIANTHASEDAKGATWLAKELWSGEFRRSITLPFAVDTEKVDARFDHGVLRVTLPKAESAKPRTIAINGAAPEQIAETSSAPAEATE